MVDLFKPRIHHDRLHPSFKHIIESPRLAPVMPVIQGWGQGLLDRNGERDKFINEFQSTFNSAMWELYINRVILDLGFTIDFTKNSPDFCVTTKEGYRFNIEAVISDANHQKPKYKFTTHEKFKNEGALKLIGKLNDKIKIFRGDEGKKFPYSSMDHVAGVPFVIAIAPFDNDISLMQNNELINLVLFGIGAPAMHPQKGWDRAAGIRKLYKDSGADVEVGIFTNPSFKQISAVIFSTTGTFGKAVIESGIDQMVRSTRYRTIDKSNPESRGPLWSLGVSRSYVGNAGHILRERSDFCDKICGSDMLICPSSMHRETHLDGLHIYYNPYADHPLDTNIFKTGKVTHNFYDVESSMEIMDHPDGALVSRSVYDRNCPMLRRVIRSYGFFA